MEKFFPFAWCVMGKNCQPVDTVLHLKYFWLSRRVLCQGEGLLTIGSMAILGTPSTPIEWGELSLCYPTAGGLYPDLAISFIHSHKKYLLSILYMPDFLPGAFKQQGVRDNPWAQKSYLYLRKWTMTVANDRCWGHVAMRTDRKGAHISPNFSLLICKMGIVSPLQGVFWHIPGPHLIHKGAHCSP